MSVRRAFLLTLAFLPAACAPSDDAGADLESWNVSADPMTTIGLMEGDAPYLFQDVRAAQFTADGRIVVADGGHGAIRVFDADGRFLAEMGGEGEGPGEFLSLRDIWIASPDTIGAWDSETLRVSYFESDGTLARTVGLEPSGESAGVGNLDFMVGVLPEGTLLVGSVGLGADGDPRPDRVSIERFGPDGAHLGRLAEVTGLRRRMTGPVTGPVPFSPFPYFAVADGAVLFTNGEAPAIRVWEGGAERTLELPPAGHDPAAAWAALGPELEASGHPLADLFLGQLDRVPRSDSIPHLAGLIVDDAGYAWTKRYEAPDDALWLSGGQRVHGGRWWVVRPKGGLVALAELPSGLIPLQVSGDLVLGLTVDEMGIERVQVHALERGSGG